MRSEVVVVQMSCAEAIARANHIIARAEVAARNAEIEHGFTREVAMQFARIYWQDPVPVEPYGPSEDVK